MARITRLILAGLLLCVSYGANADTNTDCSNSRTCYNSGVYIYEGGQDLVDLYSMSGTTNMNANDDYWSGQVDLGMEWNRWGQTWGHAKMSTNGCVNMRGGSAGGNSDVCSDYTPQALPYRNYTLYPMWTDHIRGTASGGQTSKMLFKDFGDYVVFGWYYMREYNRSSSNSFEAILYDNNSYEYRYRELDITQHDVLIGEQGNNSTTPADTKTYLFFRDYESQFGGCQSLDQFFDAPSQCNEYDGPDLENGGSLFSGTETQMCEINALYSTSCSGYAAAYLAQQCALDTLYNSACTGYAAALLIFECNLDVFYASSCDGYAAAVAQEEALYDAIYGTNDDMYGDDGSNEYGYEDEYGYDEYGNAYTQDDMWYDEEFDEYLDPNDPCYQNNCADFTDADWYALDTEQFGQEQVDEWYGTDPEFSAEGYIDYGTQSEEEYWTEIDQGMDTYDQEQEALWAAEELAWQQEEQRMYEEELVMIQEQELAWAEEEAFYESLETDAEWYDYEVEEFGQEQVDEWWGEDVSFNEEGGAQFEETYYDEELYAQVDNIYILEETIGVEIFTEEEWSTEDELDIYEEVLEDYEREAIEEHEEEIFEEFDEEYTEEELYLEEDEAFEDLINEEELDELINEDHEEEFYEEEHEEFYEEENTRDDDSDEPDKEKSFTVMIAQQEQQQEQQTIQQAVSQDSAPSSSQAVVSAIDFGGTQQDQTTVADVLQEQLEDSSGSTTGGSFDSNSFSTGSGGTIASSSQQEQVSQSTGDTLVMDQQDQVTGQVQIQVATIDDSGPAVTAFEVSEQQQEQQDEQQVLTFDDGSSFTAADQSFETSFDDALGAGQSIGQFLSNTTPSFSKFDIAPPTVSEQNVSSAVESLADRVGSQVAAQNLQAQIQDVQQGGGFDVDQTATVAYIGYTAGFSDYTGQEQLSDRDDWYISKTLYKDKKIDDNKFSFYMMAGKTQAKLQKMINSQYNQ